MKAVVYTTYGSPDVLQFQDVEKPRRVGSLASYRATCGCLALFQNPPSEPCLILSYHTALQTCVTCFGNGSARMEVYVAGMTDDKRFALHRNHPGDPKGFVFPTAPTAL